MPLRVRPAIFAAQANANALSALHLVAYLIEITLLISSSENEEHRTKFQTARGKLPRNAASIKA